MRWGMMFIVIIVALWGMYELFRKFSLIEPLPVFGKQDSAEPEK